MKKQVIYTIIIALIFLGSGFGLLHYNLFGYGYSFFTLLPFILGCLVGDAVIRKASMIGLIIALGIFIILLYYNALEGMLCILLALPIIIFCLSLGIWIRNYYLNSNKSKKPNDIIKTSLLPFIGFILIGLLERKIENNQLAIDEVVTLRIFPYSKEQVYDAIKSVDTLIGDTPLFMKLDLPIPLKCILDEESIGAKRVCYFNDGTIVEEITEIERAKILRMNVIEYNLRSRPWLHFKEAIYKFEPIEFNNTKLTRITTYTSALQPRFYWRLMERLAISQEHDYVLENMDRILQNKH